MASFRTMLSTMLRTALRPTTGRPPAESLRTVIALAGLMTVGIASTIAAAAAFMFLPAVWDVLAGSVTWVLMFGTITFCVYQILAAIGVFSPAVDPDPMPAPPEQRAPLGGMGSKKGRGCVGKPVLQHTD